MRLRNGHSKPGGALHTSGTSKALLEAHLISVLGSVVLGDGDTPARPGTAAVGAAPRVLALNRPGFPSGVGEPRAV